jgi:hypothetical protein
VKYGKWDELSLILAIVNNKLLVQSFFLYE